MCNVNESENMNKIQQEQAKRLFDVFSQYKGLKAQNIKNEELYKMYQLFLIPLEQFIGMGKDILYWIMLNGESLELGDISKEIKGQIEQTKILCDAFRHSSEKEVWQLASDMEKICEILQYLLERNLSGAIQFYEMNREKFYHVFREEEPERGKRNT